jgi:hypothetical protein
MKTLVLHAKYHDTYSYYDDWLAAFRAEPANAEAVNVCEKGSIEAARRIDEHDLVVLLQSTNADALHWLRPWIGPLRDRKRARVLVLVGNEYNAPRSHVGMKEKRAFLAQTHPELIGTGLRIETSRWLYGELGKSRVVALPGGLNPDRFKPGPPHDRRPLDLGVRTARYSALLGDMDRVEIVERFQKGPLPFPLDMDLAIGGGRKTPDEWAAFLASCRGTVTTEAGAAYLERDDRTANAIADFLARRHWPLRLFGGWKRIGNRWLSDRVSTVTQLVTEQLIRFKITPGPDAVYAAADAEEITARFFTPPPTPHSGKCISSRHFEAMGTKTCPIMFPGRFNDILVADRHYLALARDFSNLDEVVARFRDPAVRERIVEEAYALVMEKHTFRHRVEEALRLAAE